MFDSSFSIAQISDLHFSEGTDRTNPDHSHSIEHLVALERFLGKMDLDLIVVSGDISNHGDRQSLINASAYIFDQIPLGAEEYTGLKLPAAKVGVVPGNHDAWNANQSGSLLDRRQKSLNNYNFAFKSHKIPNHCGCYYNWMQKGDNGIFFAFVDSCFLGDTEEYESSPFGTIRYDQAVAKGKLSVHQTEKLLEWHDLGMKGTLPIPNANGNPIDKNVFAKALKIIVMHHYLFEPTEHKSDYFMRIHDRNVVFRNIAFADFDILLCGHKHFPAFDTYAYGDHFDSRATNRYVINYFRRLIGLHSLPVQLEDQHGRPWKRSLTLLTNILLKLVRKNVCQGPPGEVAENVIMLLRSGLDDPDSLENRVKMYLQQNGISGAEIIESGELKEIQKRIAIGLSISDRKRINQVADRLAMVAKKLQSRPFVQIMCGSTAKACSAMNKKRTFNIHRVSCQGDKWTMRSERYLWDWNSAEYLPDPQINIHEFKKII